MACWIVRFQFCVDGLWKLAGMTVSLPRGINRRRHTLADVEERRKDGGRLRDGAGAEEAGSSRLVLGGVPQVHIQRHDRVATTDHGVRRDVPGEANAGLEVVVVAIVKSTLRLNPASHAATRRAGDRTGDRVGIVIVRRRQAAHAQPSRKLTVRRTLGAIADTQIESELGQDPPVILEIEAVDGGYGKRAGALLGVAVLRDVAQHQRRDADAARVGDGLPVALEPGGEIGALSVADTETEG